MLRVERASLGQFGEPELEALIQSGGWQSVMPHALPDVQLLGVAGQLRGLLSGQGWDNAQGQGSAALAMTLLLLSKGRSKRPGQDKLLDVEMATLHEVMTLLSVTVDREIVNRMLDHKEDATGPNLMQGIEELTRYSHAPARAPSLV